ncbi:hypothetical protein EV421DRAFT_1730545 [Armillaria borealis]|uniref:Gfd2/YDR514C-like C-terminal domain-containing protein n=1 Tax=Armillaria borealis TaxID=47425 RepID=A0AA39K2Y1_9AGAR|nr:hypothetical protein EV421DRAFT_1730545 [Armillaria borealis]
MGASLSNADWKLSLQRSNTTDLVFTGHVPPFPGSSAGIDGYSHILPDAIPETGIYVIDTVNLFGGLLGEGSPGNKRSLDTMCRQLKVPTKHLHNAGDDAHYTLAALKLMATGAPLDVLMLKESKGGLTTLALVEA